MGEGEGGGRGRGGGGGGREGEGEGEGEGDSLEGGIPHTPTVSETESPQKAATSQGHLLHHIALHVDTTDHCTSLLEWFKRISHNDQTCQSGWLA